MTATYEIKALDILGTQLATLDKILKLEYMRSVNNIGALKLTLSGDFNLSLLQLDGRLLLYRSVDKAPFYLETNTAWWIRRYQRILNQNKERVIEVTAYSAVELLKRRIVAYNAGTSYAGKTAAADDMIKAIVRENLGSLATDGTRDITSYLTVQADTTLGPSISKSFARRNVLTVCQEIAQQAAQAGTRIYFDVVAPSYNTLEFQTYVTQLGMNHTFTTGFAPVVFSAERGSVASGMRGFDYSDEINYVFAGGQGTDASRNIQTATDSTRSGASPINLREGFRNASAGTTNAYVLAEANAALRDGRPLKLFDVKLNPDVDGSRYGKDFKWGDTVTVTFEGDTFDVHVDAVNVSVADKVETIGLTLRTVDT